MLVVGGCPQTPGAVILAGLAALRVGAGVLQIASSDSVAPGIALAVPEARVVSVPTGPTGRWILRPGGKRRADAAACDALLIGPGMPRGSGAAARAWVRDSLRRGADTRAIVVDAGALEIFSGRKPLTANAAPAIILTPHPGEMATLWGVTPEYVLANARKLTTTLANSNEDFEQLLSDGNLLLGELDRRRQAIHDLLTGAQALATQLSGLVKDNTDALKPALSQLNTVTDLLTRQNDNLAKSLAAAGPYFRLANNALGNGRWLDSYLCGLLPENRDPCVPPKQSGAPK